MKQMLASRLAPFLAAAAVVACHGQTAADARRFDTQGFEYYHEFYGPGGASDPQASANLGQRMATGVAFSPPLDSRVPALLERFGAGFILQLAAATVVDGATPEYIEQQRQALKRLAESSAGRLVSWNLMPEWDQSGGNWVSGGRPRYGRLSRAEAYARFLDYYQKTITPLSSYLQQPAPERKYRLAAVTDYSPNVYYAYEMGVDLNLLERGIDELGDLATGVAFARGAARQYDRQWGIDLSTWRTSNDMATTFDERGTLLGGWSASYLRRHSYLAYMSGAHVLLNEATGYAYRNGQLNPFGQMVKEFADFALNRHPDIGLPVVSTALLIDHFSGFAPKHWLYAQRDAVWYQDLPYTEGDHMINNFLKAAFPNHWMHGLAYGAPFLKRDGEPDTAAFQSYLAAGNDPRPFEPMPFTRWGGNLDVITSRAPLEALRRYKVIVLLGSVSLGGQLRSDLRTWVREGGTLVVNVNQMGTPDEAFFGVRVDRTVSTASESYWLAGENVSIPEPDYRYSLVLPLTAETLGATSDKDPLVTSNRQGQGRVILCSPHYLQSGSKDELLGIGTRLMDWLHAANSPVVVSGPQIEYIVNRAPGRLIVTLANHTGVEWAGTILFKSAGREMPAREWITERETETVISAAGARVAARVPAYDLRIYAFDIPEQRQ